MKPARLSSSLRRKTRLSCSTGARQTRTVQPPLAGEDVLGLLMDEHTVANLLRQTQESILMQRTVADVGGAVALGLLGSLLERRCVSARMGWPGTRSPRVNQRWQPR